MTGNPLSGHTAANHASAMTGSGVFTDSLEDGEHITSPSLTNMLEGVHGNGIMLEEDTAGTASIRDNPEDLPGVCEQVTNTHTVRIVGGHAVLDGVLYKFAGGPGSSQDVAFTTGSAHKRATYSALSSGQEVLIVVYISSDTTNQCITWEMGTPVTTASNTYPTTPSAFLSNPKSSGLDVKQSVVLAVVRAVYSASGGDLNLSITESNDKRVFVRPTPMYMSPVTSGVVGATTAVASHTALDAYNQDTGDLTASRFGALWQSYNTDGDAVLYYSAKDSGGTRHTHVLGPTGYVTASPSGTSTFTFNEGQVFVLNPSTAVQFNPTGTFPAGHTVYVTNDAAHDTNAITFDNAGIGMVLKGKESGFFVYTGSAWKNVMLASGAVSPNGHGANGLLQLSDGGGGFTSDTKLSWNSGTPELVVDGKLTVTGLIDPPGLVIDEKVDIAATGHTTAAGKGLLWVKSDTPNRLYFTDDAGTDKKVIHATDSVTELTDVSAVGSGSIITTAERNKLTGIETGATGDQSNAEIRAAVEAATDSNVFTDSDHTKLNGIEASADVTDTANVVAALTAGTNVAIAVDGTISATDTNTEYTVGDGGLTQKNFTTTLKNKLDGIEGSADVTDTANVVAALTAGTNVTIAGDGTINATDTNTEYTVGDGGLTQKNFTTTLKNKLDGIEASATADQTDAEIRAAVEAATDSNVFTDADHSKLNGIASSATAYADSDAISAVEGEADLALAGQVNFRADVGVVTSDPTPAIADSGTIYQFTKGSAGTFTLPASPTVGVQYVLVNGDGQDIVITRPNSNYKINGSTSSTVTNTTAYAATSIVCVVAGSSGEWLVFGGI